ncbi:MAG: hypothetical protein AAGD13_05365 [Pseudomonadota bacterium]
MTKQRFLRDESGAVTIDWVGLSAGILLLGIAVVYGIFTAGVPRVTGQINSELTNFTPLEAPTVVPTTASFSTGGSGS